MKYNSDSRSFKRVIAKAKSEHIGRIGEKLVRLPSGIRAFWSLAKAVQGNFCQPSVPSMHREDDSLGHTAKEKADLLGSFFASNSSLDSEGSTPPANPRCECSMPEVQFTQRSVRKALLSLNIRKSSGPDGIPSTVDVCSIDGTSFNASFLVLPLPRRSPKIMEDGFRPLDP
ncbi:unnamed protein product [Parnassius apollo]|uniref:(apollo) hypothetical protein n=1 Tax=Parnassius apollo TaxID=110799 RepID=A0A8S3YCM1_PARAO|nr:unnamed protein product [Parnassius apollo]